MAAPDAPVCPPDVTSVVVYAPSLDLACPDGQLSCTARVPIRVTNCTEAPVELRRVVVREAARDVLFLEPAAERRVLDPKESFTHSITLGKDARFDLIAEGDHGPLGATTFVITNAARDAAIAACEACRGVWGPLGLSGHVACNCRTKDAGAFCDDGDNCEGDCMFERFEVVVPAKPFKCVGNECSGRIGTGRPVGRCSDWQRNFGCKTFVPSGASKQPPVMLPGHASLTCRD